MEKATSWDLMNEVRCEHHGTPGEHLRLLERDHLLDYLEKVPLLTRSENPDHS
jgi:hypothetical protein